jgi:ERCC4-type nuclease
MQENGTTIQLRLSAKMNQTLPPNIYGADVRGEAYEFKPGQYASEWLAINEPEVGSLLQADRCICIFDSNEASQNPETVADLRGFNIDIAVSSLIGTGADIVPSSRIGIQRKTYDDLSSSISNGRLFSEMDELVSSYEIPILMIEGIEPTRSHMQATSVEGVLAFLCRTIPDIRIVVRPNRYTCSLFIKSLIFGEQTDRHHMPSLKQWKQADDLNEARLAITQQLPGIGPRKSRRMLREKKTIDEVAQLSEIDLRRYTYRSKEAAKVLHEPFEENK